MAFRFGKKKQDDDAGNGSDGGVGTAGGADGFTPDPEKARKWFDHARTSASTFNYDYALMCYAKGICFDPDSMQAHEQMHQCAVRYQSGGGKPATSKDVKGIDDGTPIGKFAAAEFEWMKDLQNFKAAGKLLDAAIRTERPGILEFGNWLAPIVFRLLRAQKKVSKGMLVGFMKQCQGVGHWELALAAGEAAKQLDPTDSDLDAEIKNLAAERAMDAGRYGDASGEGGGFRGSIKDADKQRELIEDETLAAGASTEERVFARAKAAYEAEPELPDNINRFAQLLVKRGDSDSVREAIELYRNAHEATGEYRFKMKADDLLIQGREAKVRRLTERLAQNEGDEKLQAELGEARTKLLTTQANAYVERVKRYPTDRDRKYDLGRVQFELGQYQDAMAQFQAAKDEPRLQARSAFMLGRCFLAEGWFGEAVGEFDEAIAALDATQKELELDVKYELMLALIEQSKAERELEAAKRAKTICSEIARRNITYRDIRAKRNEVDEVIKDLEGG